MFEFGRDLRKLFAQARESEDLSWLELIGVDLLAGEARGQTTDAGRVSTAKPHQAWLRASCLWREHARRSGRADSLDRAMAADADAARTAGTPDEMARAAVARAQTLLLKFDLCGGRDVLDLVAEAAPDAAHCKSSTVAQIAGVQASLRARFARLDGGSTALMQAAGFLDAAIHQIERSRAGETESLRLERAALALEAGVSDRNPQLLDQAGRDLIRLVETASPDYRPLTRARALTLCGAGLSALGALADNTPACEQGRAMFEAAAEQFTPDHSPLDWVAIQVIRAGMADADGRAVALPALRQADALTSGQGLILGALARDMLAEGEIAAAASVGDLSRLARSEAIIRQRLGGRQVSSELDWAIDQMAMARIARARSRLTGADASAANLGLFEAAEVARERGLPALSARAQTLIACRAEAA